jgi:hypothetical protein
MRPKELELLITQHAAELVQELLNTVCTDDGLSWFHIIDRKMHRLIKQTQRKQKHK